MEGIATTEMNQPAKSEVGKNIAIFEPGSRYCSSQQSDVLPDPTPQDPLVFTREDWTEFRDIDRISARAGVRRPLLPKLAVKELVDNAFDVSDNVQFGLLETRPDRVSFFVQDEGSGIPGDDAAIAVHFSIRRPLTSSKTRRMPTMGMLGNGIRAVVGVVLVSGGKIKVSTRGRTLTLVPRPDGTTEIVHVEPWEGNGTRVEVTLHGSMAQTALQNDLFEWANVAQDLAVGQQYKGKSSAWWYSSSAFWELLQAGGKAPIERLVETLEGCSDRKKAEVVVGSFRGRACNSLTQDESTQLLNAARGASKHVAPERLGKVDRREDYFGYAKEVGTFDRDGSTIPFVVEVWANRADRPGATVCVNRTPVVTQIDVRREEGSNYAIFGAGLRHLFQVGMKRSGEYQLLVNVICPFVPLTSSGKDPDLTAMLGEIICACEKAVRVARRTAPNRQRKSNSQKSVILRHLNDATVTLSGHGTCIFSLRQLFYFIRPFLIPVIGREPNYGTFCRIIGEYEDACEEIEGLYRDDRGTLYHPHTSQCIPLGTRSVAKYERPQWVFNKILYCEKEGFFPILQQARWPERHDCALLTSKGYATRAVREVLRIMRANKEPITVFCLHDADGPGTMIYEALARELKRYGIRVVNLGLDPAEAREIGLIPEPVAVRKKKKNGEPSRVPVAEYIPADDKQWLQKNRIELNAMSTPQFIAFLDRKVQDHVRHGKVTKKVVPPVEVIHRHFEAQARNNLTRRLTEETIRKAGISKRVDAIMQVQSANLIVKATAVTSRLPAELINQPEKHWSDLVNSEVSKFGSDISE